MLGKTFLAIITIYSLINYIKLEQWIFFPQLNFFKSKLTSNCMFLRGKNVELNDIKLK
jgi:hypothetical protein